MGGAAYACGCQSLLLDDPVWPRALAVCVGLLARGIVPEILWLHGEGSRAHAGLPWSNMVFRGASRKAADAYTSGPVQECGDAERWARRLGLLHCAL